MTLIVGIKCQEGVVIGADSAVTSATGTGQQTAMQPSKKLSIIDNKIIIGVSGQVGLAQFFKNEVEQLWKSEICFKNKTVEQVRLKITDALRKHLKREREFASSTRDVLETMMIQNELTSHTLIALPIKKGPTLLEFPLTLSSEEKDERFPTVAIGIAQPIADPFLCFLRRVFWPDQLPTIGQGKLAAYWVLDYSIKASPGNVSLPIKMAILENSNGDFRAYELDDQELSNLGQAVDDAERFLKGFNQPEDKQTGEIPKP